MRSAYEREEESSDTELTLGMTSLLGIFFGLVLICGVFFGFGYSMGRHKPETSAPVTPASEPEAALPQLKTPVSEPVQTPSASQQMETANSQDAAEVRPTLQPAVVTESHKSSARIVEPAAAPEKATVPVTKQAAAVSGPPSMVQIAAVSRQEDAEALVSALRKRGYNVSIHSEPHDKLLHVQAGPLATRDEAKAMRARLQSDGYNAIIKP